MKTTVEIPDALLRQLRVRAASEGTSMKSLIAAALRQFPGGRRGPGNRRFRLKDGSVRGMGLTDEFRNADWAKIRDEIYRGHGGKP